MYDHICRPMIYDVKILFVESVWRTEGEGLPTWNHARTFGSGSHPWNEVQTPGEVKTWTYFVYLYVQQH